MRGYEIMQNKSWKTLRSKKTKKREEWRSKINPRAENPNPKAKRLK